MRYAVSEAEGKVTAIDVKALEGVRVGYVMGVGDEVPAALAQIGARVTLLGRNALEASDLNAFDTIVTGTRAYAVRDDLRAFNGRLLDWVRSGGNLVVLYNTPEINPRRFAPFAGASPTTPRRWPRSARRSPSSRPATPCSRHRTKSAPPISRAGSSSADPSFSPSGTPPMCRWWSATIAISPPNEVAG